ncbi:MAG: JDVT-CTERM domain-containing protein [Pseudomonadota bacterium]
MLKYLPPLLAAVLVSSPALAAIDLASPSDTWSSVLVGDNFDPGQDTQAVAAVDLTGFGTTPLFYMKYDDGGTAGDTTDDTVAFRFRADNAVDNKGAFSGYIWIGMDVDLDNDIDAFMMLVGKNGAYSLDVYDAGTGANTSPNTTDVNAASQTAVTTGFGFNHSLITSIDVGGIADQDADGDPDYLISYSVNMDALTTALNALTLTDPVTTELISTLNGGAGMTRDTPFQLVAASAQNDNALNGDIGGFNDKTDDLAVDYSTQGAMSGVLTFSNPVPVDSVPPATPTVASQITSNTQPTITGTFDSTDYAGGFTVIVDGVTYTLGTDPALSNVGDTWSLDLAIAAHTPLADGTYSVVATATDGAGNPAADATVNELVVNTAAPTSPTVVSQITSNTQPTITGTFDSTNAAGGFTVTVDGTIYTLGTDAALTNVGDIWSLDLSTAGQTLIDGTYDVLATVTDGATNSSSDATANELVIDTTPPTTPTVAGLITNNNQPIISGTFDSTDVAGGFTVTVDGVTYTLGTDAALTISGNNWNVNLLTGGQTLADGTYDVVVTAIDAAGNSSTDLTTNEVQIDTVVPAAPTVIGLVTSNTQPTLSGTFDSADAAGGFTVTVDGVTYTLGSDAALTNTVDSWSLDLSVSAHTLVNSTYEVVATIIDSAGNAATDSSSNELIVEADSDGDGVVDSNDLDDDNDGIPDTVEGSGLVDTDGDGVFDSLDLDSDNDGLYDLIESGISTPSSLDSDNDGRIDSSNSVGTNGLANTVETTNDSGTLNYTVADTDSDGVKDFRDRDSDNDGINDVVESGGTDGDNDGRIGTGDPLVDGSGVPGDGPLSPLNSDGDGTPNYRDLDSDNDGVNDVIEAGGSDPDDDGVIGDGLPTVDPVTGLPAGGSLVPEDLNGDGLPDYLDNTDSDADGTPDTVDLDDDNDGIPDTDEGSGVVDSDGDGIPDSLDLDSDNDGLYDLTESGIIDPAVMDVNDDGRIDDNGVGDTNGLADSVETSADSGTINYPVADTDGDLVEDFRDRDSDNDGINDVIESGGSDGDNDGRIGTGAPSVDVDGIPTGGPIVALDTDGDTIANYRDLDSDNDGLYDVIEADGPDANGDGMAGDTAPVVVDGSGVPADGNLIPVDTDGDLVDDYRDLDSDNDGIPDVTEAGGDDGDGDGIIGIGNPVVNGGGVPAGGPIPPVDTDGDGTDDQRDLDSDGDGNNDIIEAGGIDSDDDGKVDGFTDSDGDGFDDGLSVTPLPLPDGDGDGIPDFQDADDTDNDGIQDYLDLDDDNDGIPDAEEGDGLVDTDGDGIPDSRDLDSDNDGIFDLTESGITASASLDVDNNGRIDGNGAGDTNGLADIVETSPDSDVLNYTVVDTDGDGVKDFRDLDSDNDGIPDVLENGGNDPDANGLIGSGVPPAVNPDGIAIGTTGDTKDTDNDGTPDYLDLDSDNDGEKDLTEVGGPDVDDDGMVDDFTDLDGDGYDDTISITPLAAVDTNNDGTLDYLEPARSLEPASSNVIKTGLAGVGGCSMVRNAPFDPILPMLFLISLLFVARGSFRTVVQGVRNK